MKLLKTPRLPQDEQHQRATTPTKPTTRGEVKSDIRRAKPVPSQVSVGKCGAKTAHIQFEILKFSEHKNHKKK
jgi:hypothetical protein